MEMAVFNSAGMLWNRLFISAQIFDRNDFRLMILVLIVYCI